MPKIIGSSIGEHREKTRQSLFYALSSLLQEKPFEQITMSEISKVSGVGRTAVYNHFKDKESLLLALMSAATEEFATVLSQALQLSRDPITQLRIYVRAQLELKKRYHLAEGTSLRGVATAGFHSELKAHGSLVAHILHHLLNNAKTQQAITVEPNAQIINLIHSCLAAQALPRDQNERQRVMTQVENFILRAVGASEEAIARVDPAVRDLRFIGEDEDLAGTEQAGNVRAGESTSATYLRCPVIGA